MKHRTIFVFTLCAMHFFYGQRAIIDRLKCLLANSEDTAKVMTLSRINWPFTLNAPYTALSYSRQGIEFAKKLGFAKGE